MKKQIINTIFNILPEIKKHHQPNDEVYISIDNIFKNYFNNTNDELINLGEISFKWPKINLGNLNSYNFFCLGEIIIYKFYEINRHLYNIAFDVGANIGIDSIVLSSLGYDVHAIEPDPENIIILKEILELNGINNNFHIHNVGLSNDRGTEEFIRVKGNITANHVVGARKFYGNIEKFKAKLIKFEDLGISPDIMKINIEGYEKILVPSIPINIWEKCDAFIEIHSEEDRRVLFDYFNEIGVNIFSQKICWSKSKKVDELPTKYTEGNIFVSKKAKMPW